MPEYLFFVTMTAQVAVVAADEQAARLLLGNLRLTHSLDVKAAADQLRAEGWSELSLSGLTRGIPDEASGITGIDHIATRFRLAERASEEEKK